MRSGARLAYLRFWGHSEARQSEVGKACLSQWYPAEFTIDGLRFATGEHYMMVRKAQLTCEWLAWFVYQKFWLLTPLDRLRVPAQATSLGHLNDSAPTATCSTCLSKS